MNNFQKQYYNQPEHWSKNFSKIKAEEERIKEIINIIPIDINSILDVGCGNGFFINQIAKKKRYKKLIGMDPSKEALKYVKTKKIIGNINNAPFEENSFDLVTCLEVLEHLPLQDFKKGIVELQRISKKYILITVPNNQSLEHSLVRCPECYCWFNPCFHMRTFNKNKMKKLFNNYDLVKLKEVGPLRKKYLCSKLLTLYLRYKKPSPPETSICPQCGYAKKIKNKTNHLKQKNSSSAKNIFLKYFEFFGKKFCRTSEVPRWLIALYKKNEK